MVEATFSDSGLTVLSASSIILCLQLSFSAVYELQQLSQTNSQIDLFLENQHFIDVFLLVPISPMPMALSYQKFRDEGDDSRKHDVSALRVHADIAVMLDQILRRLLARRS